MHSVIIRLIEKYPDLKPCGEDMERAFEILKRVYENKGKVLVGGNGGSASDSEHIVGELMKGFMSRRSLQQQLQAKLKEAWGEDGDYLARHLQGALPAISLVSHSALSTAISNDVAGDMIFAQQVFGFGQEQDALILLSTSGNSSNVVRAAQVARTLGMKVIGMTGSAGGRLKELCDVVIRVPFDSTPDIQERHLPIYHALCIMLEEAFFQ